MVQLKEEDDVAIKNDELVMVCVGEVGAGKSTLLNLLLSTPGKQRENDHFLEGNGVEACTKYPKNKVAFWRGNTGRALMAIDTAGIGKDSEEDTQHILDVINHLKNLGYVHVFVIVLKGVELKFLPQHIMLFRMFETMFGESFWENVLIVIPNQMNDEIMGRFQSWMEKLLKTFPTAKIATSRKIYIDIEMVEESALEHFWNICREMKKYPCHDFHTANTQMNKLKNNSNEVTNDIDRRSLEVSNYETDHIAETNDRQPHTSTTIPKEENFLAFPSSPLLPPRSPTFSRAIRISRTPSFTSRSIPNLQLPKSYMPPTTLVDDFILTSSVTLKSLRRSRKHDILLLSSRETSPIKSVCSSRESSPSRYIKKTSNFLRTSYALKYPFIKTVKDKNEAYVNYALEERILLESIDDFYITSAPNLISVSVTEEKSSIGKIINIAYESMDFALEEHMEHNVIELEPSLVSDFQVAKELEEEERKLDFLATNSLTDHNPLLLVRKALLPKIKYRWEQGFRQGATGWEKVPILKIKFKYSCEDSLLLPSMLSVEGGRWCESRKVALDMGKGKIKLKADQDAAPHLRVVPLNKEERPEMWVPEFLFCVETAYKSERLAGDKWCKVKLNPAMPE